MSTASKDPREDVAEELVRAMTREDQLLRLYASTHDPSIEAELVERLMPLARSLALRYRGGLESDDDLIQVASLALVKALRGYDPERGRRFAAYAAPTILGELRRHFRDHAWRLHMPRRLQESALAVESASTELADELGRAPSVAQIADKVGISEEDVLDALQARRSQRSVSLDRPVHDDEPDSTTMGDTIGSSDLAFDQVEAQLAIERCAELTAQERVVIELRFARDLNQYEIADRLGISQMQVSRVLRRGLAKLLEAVQGDESPEGRRTYRDDSHDPRLPNGRKRRRRPRVRATA